MSDAPEAAAAGAAGAQAAPGAHGSSPQPPRLPLRLEILLVAAAGALQTLAFVHTSAWPLQAVAIAGLAWRVALHEPRRAALLGFVFGSAWLGAGTWWLFVSLHRYGGLPAALAVAAVAALAAFLSLYLAAAMAAFARWRSGRAATDALLFGALWLLAELARGVIFTGFPWVASGYAHVDSPLRGLAPWIGVYGIGAVLAGVCGWWGTALAGRLPPPGPGTSPAGAAAPGSAGAPFAAPISAAAPSAARRWLIPIAATVGVLGLGLLAGVPTFSAPSGRLSITLLQGNVPQDEKFAAEHLPETMGWALDHLVAARGDLVVAPETVIPLLPEQLDPAYWGSLLHRFQDSGQAALVGLPLGNDEVGYSNSAAGVSDATRGLPNGYYRYDKHHLVPFGEFIPLGFHWFTRMMNIPLGDFNRGALAQPSFAVKGERVAPNICYEDLFGEELAARFTDPAAAPTLFANLSNIAWFGDTIAVGQHLQISRMRTLEFERPMVRATNTGATAIIDHRGVVTASLAPHTQGTLDGSVEGRTGVTPFARWAAAFGLWPLWIAGAVVVLAAWRRRSRP